MKNFDQNQKKIFSLGDTKSQIEIFPFLISIQRVEIERIRKEMMNNRAKS